MRDLTCREMELVAGGAPDPPQIVHEALEQAQAAWNSLGKELAATGIDYSTVIGELTGSLWTGPAPPGP
jgi:PPE-repeat protein